VRIGLAGVSLPGGGDYRQDQPLPVHGHSLLVEESARLPEEGLSMRRLLHDAPSLQARQLGKQQGWQDLLAPEVARRLGVPGYAYWLGGRFP
jgi:hypothetical protein